MIRNLILATAALTALFAGQAAAQDTPTPPATFFGSVKVDGENVPDGTQVIALIEGKQCGEAETASGQKGTWTATQDEAEYDIKAGDSLYAVDVVSDNQTPGCGKEGAIVTFLVAGKPAHQKGLWKAGPNYLGLTAGTPPGGELTPTPAGGETPAAAVGQQDESDGGFAWWPWAAAGGGLIVVAALAVWWRLRKGSDEKAA